jgi:Rrf2 family protein
VNISAKSDYAVRALIALAAADSASPVKSEWLATSQHIPVKFLENILLELRKAGIITSVRGADGGHRLARPPDRINLAQVIRAVDGPLANIRGVRPEAATYRGDAACLQDVWIAMRASLRSVLEAVTLADVVKGKLPPRIRRLAAEPDAWLPH